jgi:hypothetical protein
MALHLLVSLVLQIHNIAKSMVLKELRHERWLVDLHISAKLWICLFHTDLSLYIEWNKSIFCGNMSVAGLWERVAHLGHLDSEREKRELNG